MIRNTISQYVRALFDESRDGELLAGDADDQFNYPVLWDVQIATELAIQCSTLIGQFTELSHRFESLCIETQHLTAEQLDVWNTYLRPFPAHDLDMVKLTEVWEKIGADMELSKDEWDLADRYADWFTAHAMTRLPVKCCTPVQMISRARRYSRLIQLNAPKIVQENEAKRFAEEYILYHCMQKDPQKV